MMYDRSGHGDPLEKRPRRHGTQVKCHTNQQLDLLTRDISRTGMFIASKTIVAVVLSWQ